jgi:uncharacterized repeat protein (TIGR03803 family)
MKKVQEATVRKTLTVATSTSRIPWRALIGLVAAIGVMSIVVLSGQELKHVPPAAPSFMVLYSFAGHPMDGQYPVADLVRDAAGNLYGTTIGGGGSNACFPFPGCGTIFKVGPTGTETILHTFTRGDGANPAAALVRDTVGNLYGTAGSGGPTGTCYPPYGCGVVFKLSPSGTYTILHSFTGAPDGAFPNGLIEDAAGNFYGTTSDGGTSSSTCFNSFVPGCGAVFKLSPSGTETLLYSFTGGLDGANPDAALVRDAAGNLYGTTVGGGVSSACPDGCGTAFKLSPSGAETVLHSFTGGADGGQPVAGLIRDAAGNLYGTTTVGGSGVNRLCQGGTCGVVFKLSPSGTETVLHNFTRGDGATPNADLIQDAAGNLYGTTFGGGAHGHGVVFELIRCSSSPSGYDFKVLYNFTGGADGTTPFAGLVRDTAGNLYGTTAYGGTLTRDCNAGCGVVFRLTP